MKTRLIRCSRAPFVLSIALVLGCSVPAPIISDLALTPNANRKAPLAASCTFRTDKPTLATLVFSDGEHTTALGPNGDYATEHDILILGLRPGRNHSVQVTVRDKVGNETVSEPMELTTDPLPDGFPPVDLRVSRPRKMEPGVTLIPAVRWPGRGGPDDTYGVILAVDAHGDVVWFYRANHNISSAQRIRNGHILYHYGVKGNLVEIDMLGNIVRQWHTTGISKEVQEGSIPVDADTFHHDVCEMPSGNLLALSTEVRRFEDYPSSETEPDAPKGPANVIGDVLVEFTRDGTVVRKWKLMDILDPYRICYESLDIGFWSGVYGGILSEPGKDWSHSNSAVYDARNNAAVMSIKNQDAVIKFDMDTSQIIWMISLPSGWRPPWDRYLLWPVGEGLYPCHEHAAEITPQGTILMFDNGTFRARPFQRKRPARENFSRAVEYRVNETTREFTQVWSYGGPADEIFFSPILGDVDQLPKTGNVLITDGGRIRAPDGSMADHPRQGHKWAHILEVTHTKPAEKVFEIVIDDRSSGWTVYRSERLASLYP